MGSSPTGGASLNSPTGGASLSSAAGNPTGGAGLGAEQQAKDALREKMNAQTANEPPIKKPSEVTGDPYDDHPGTVYACEGPISRTTTGFAGAAIGALTGTALTEFGGSAPVPEGATFSEMLQLAKRNRSGTEKLGVTTVGSAVGGAIGQSKWFNCYVNNGYNFFVHFGATQTIDKDGDEGGLARD